MRVREVMTTPAVTCRDSDGVDSCAEFMRKTNLGFFPVLDGHDKLVGVVTDRDLALRVLGDARVGTVLVGRIASRDVVSCHADDEIWLAEETLARAKKSRLVVVDGERVVGVVSLTDLGQVEEHDRFCRLYQSVTGRETSRPLPMRRQAEAQAGWVI